MVKCIFTTQATAQQRQRNRTAAFSVHLRPRKDMRKKLRRTFFRSEPHCRFRAEKRKKHARTLRERGAPKVSKMAVILIFLFSTIYYATADIPVSSDNFPTREDSCRYNLAVVRFSYCFLNFKKDFKALDVPAACKQIASTDLLLSWTFLQKATV